MHSSARRHNSNSVAYTMRRKGKRLPLSVVEQEEAAQLHTLGFCCCLCTAGLSWIPLVAYCFKMRGKYGSDEEGPSVAAMGGDGDGDGSITAAMLTDAELSSLNDGVEGAEGGGGGEASRVRRQQRRAAASASPVREGVGDAEDDELGLGGGVRRGEGGLVDTHHPTVSASSSQQAAAHTHHLLLYSTPSSASPPPPLAAEEDSLLYSDLLEQGSFATHHPPRERRGRGGGSGGCEEADVEMLDLDLVINASHSQRLDGALAELASSSRSATPSSVAGGSAASRSARTSLAITDPNTSFSRKQHQHQHQRQQLNHKSSTARHYQRQTQSAVHVVSADHQQPPVLAVAEEDFVDDPLL